KLANELTGPIRGGLAMTTSLACAFFAALSGSAPGTVAAIGSIMYPELTKQGYDEEVSAGLIAVSGGLGPIIPPSILMITFGVVTETSIGALFMGGVIPGVVILLLLLLASYVVARKRGYRGGVRNWSLKRICRSFASALPALGMPLLILGGIYGGFFTPTEAAAVAVVYGLLVGFFVYRELHFREIMPLFVKSAVSAGVVLFIISTSSAFSWLFAWSGMSGRMVASVTHILPGPVGFVLVSLIVMLVFGTFMEGNAILILLMPFLFPVAKAFGIDPTYYGVVSTVAMVVGLVTPPVAVNIYTTAGITGLSMERIVRGMWPFFAAMATGLIVTAAVPGLSTWLPKLMLR
ncbi:MAG: TRAP transporter large permease, partial [Bacillota bacterium]